MLISAALAKRAFFRSCRASSRAFNAPSILSLIDFCILCRRRITLSPSAIALSSLALALSAFWRVDWRVSSSFLCGHLLYSIYVVPFVMEISAVTTNEFTAFFTVELEDFVGMYLTARRLIWNFQCLQINAIHYKMAINCLGIVVILNCIVYS